MLTLFALLQLSCPQSAPSPAAVRDTARDTALFVYANGNRRLQQHGDTVWSVTGDTVFRVVDNGQRISVLRADARTTSRWVWCIRGDRAVLEGHPDGVRVIPVSQLRIIRGLVERAREGEAILKRLPPA